MPIPFVETPDDADDVRECPFSDPTFTLDPRLPCPICGALGGMGDMNIGMVEELCVDK